MSHPKENEPPIEKPLLTKDMIYLSITRGMDVGPGDVSPYGMGVEIQDFANLSGMRGAKEDNLKFWHDFLGAFHPPLAFHAPFIDLHPGSDETDEREYAYKRMSESMDLAEDLGAELIVVHSCWPPPSAKKYGNWDNLHYIGEHLASLGERAAEKGLLITVENIYEPNPGMLRDIVSEIDMPSVKLCLDTGHVNIKSDIQVAEWLDEYGSLLAYIHLNDNNGKKDRHMALGEGGIDFEPFFGRLRKMKYTGIICVETWPVRWQPSIARLEQENII